MEKLIFGSDPMHALADTQNEGDHRNLAIHRVGIKDLLYPLVIRDRSGEQATVAKACLTVGLPAHQRGTHMSRLVEALQDVSSLSVESTVSLPHGLRQRLQASQIYVELDFPFFLTKTAPVTEKSGLMDYQVRFSIDDRDHHHELTIAVKVPVATLCPCSKAISERGAHNQRGQVTLQVRTSSTIWIEELIFLVEECASCELYSVLKRPDEKAVTEAAYDRPVFVEDLVRNVAQRAQEDRRISWFRVEAENFESIHNHNAYALIQSE